MLQQFHNSQASLTEAREDERTRLVTLGLKEVESLADIAHRQAGTLIDGVLAVRHECLDGRVAIEGSEEAVARRHIGCHLLQFQVSHVGAMLWVPHIGIVADATVFCRPVVLPRRDHVEHIGSRAVRIAVGSHPHCRVRVIWSQGNVLLRNEVLLRRIIVVRRTICKRYRAAYDECDGKHP